MLYDLGKCANCAHLTAMSHEDLKDYALSLGVPKYYCDTVSKARLVHAVKAKEISRDADKQRRRR